MDETGVTISETFDHDIKGSGARLLSARVETLRHTTAKEEKKKKIVT